MSHSPSQIQIIYQSLVSKLFLGLHSSEQRFWMSFLESAGAILLVWGSVVYVVNSGAVLPSPPTSALALLSAMACIALSNTTSFLFLHHYVWLVPTGSYTTLGGISYFFHTLHVGSCLVRKTPVSINLVLRASLCAAMIITSVLSFSSSLARHW